VLPGLSGNTGRQVTLVIQCIGLIHAVDKRVLDLGIAVDRIPLIGLPRFPMEVPKDIGEQWAIAHILGTLDDKIELNRRMNETLEAMARALDRSLWSCPQQS